VIMAGYAFQIGYAVVEVDGVKRLKFDDEREYRRFVDRLGVGTCGIATLEEEKPHRTKTWNQVKYWKGHVCPLVADHCGMTDKQADLAMLGEKYGYVEGPTGHQLPCVTSIEDFTVEEMTELIEWALDWVPAHLEIILLPPDKNWKQHMAEARRGKVSRDIDRRQSCRA
jgi:hypothetical protein